MQTYPWQTLAWQLNPGQANAARTAKSSVCVDITRKAEIPKPSQPGGPGGGRNSIKINGVETLMEKGTWGGV